jgi:hypothetical protein
MRATFAHEPSDRGKLRVVPTTEKAKEEKP